MNTHDWRELARRRLRWSRQTESVIEHLITYGPSGPFSASRFNEMTGIHERTFRRVLRRLVAVDLAHVARRFNDTDGGFNVTLVAPDGSLVVSTQVSSTGARLPLPRHDLSVQHESAQVSVTAGGYKGVGLSPHVLDREVLLLVQGGMGGRSVPDITWENDEPILDWHDEGHVHIAPTPPITPSREITFASSNESCRGCGKPLDPERDACCTTEYERRKTMGRGPMLAAEDLIHNTTEVMPA
jgi:hypothetical protein